MIVDADMQTPLALQIRAPKAVTKKKEMDKDDEEDDGLVIECDGDKISKFCVYMKETANINPGG